MFKEMARILTKKRNEIILFFVSIVMTNVLYNGYYRWHDPLSAFIICFLVYFVQGSFYRIEEPWSLSDCIERNRWWFVYILGAMFVLGWMGSFIGKVQMSAPIVVLLSACGVWTVIFMDKANYLENETAQ